MMGQIMDRRTDLFEETLEDLRTERASLQGKIERLRFADADERVGLQRELDDVTAVILIRENCQHDDGGFKVGTHVSRCRTCGEQWTFCYECGVDHRPPACRQCPVHGSDDCSFMAKVALS